MAGQPDGLLPFDWHVYMAASFDRDTCELCGSMDGQVFKMSEYQVGLTAPPFHPWCRCCTCPYFEDMEGLGERWSRKPDGTTEKVPADMSFEEWRDKFVNRGDRDGLTSDPSDSKLNINTESAELKQSTGPAEPAQAPERVILDDAQVEANAKALAADLESGKKALVQGQGDQISASINKELDYDALPRVVSAEEFASLAEGRKVLYRGLTPDGSVSAEQMADALKCGKFYVGRGIYGCGTYTSFRRSVAESYASENGPRVALEMLLADDAKIVDYREIFTEYDTAFGIKRIPQLEREPWQEILGDVGKYAALKGYDAIAINEFLKGHDYFVILNRGKLIIKE